MNFETIIYEVEKGRARITLNRPEKLNALSVELQEELNQALWEADNDNDVHAVILRGAGRAFSAGYDITPGRRGPAPVEGKNYRGRSSFDDDAWQMEKAMRLRMAIFDMHKPVIAQVHGYCLA
ncbi:MAG: enoyl-CoA hydratase/isomerase family protein, partial [Dehalococcoidia bacterium]|nr:enoyl-CoA hydratase/isomerase family protein [Dehalococcoidia bacterium]